MKELKALQISMYTCAECNCMLTGLLVDKFHAQFVHISNPSCSQSGVTVRVALDKVTTPITLEDVE